MLSAYICFDEFVELWPQAITPHPQGSSSKRGQADSAGGCSAGIGYVSPCAGRSWAGHETLRACCCAIAACASVALCSVRGPPEVGYASVVPKKRRAGLPALQRGTGPCPMKKSG